MSKSSVPIPSSPKGILNQTGSPRVLRKRSGAEEVRFPAPQGGVEAEAPIPAIVSESRNLGEVVAPVDMIRARIAVVVDAHGNYNAAGWNLGNDDDIIHSAHDGDFEDSEGVASSALYPFWVEVYIPKPQIRTLPGKLI